ncbi:MAG: 30S ribosomal protein S2 [bacterium]|nr:30S ribosomal protein S2 [bacterium]
MPIKELDQKTILDLANIGVLYGHKKSKTHPKMRPFIGANRNEIEFLKPESVLHSLEKGIAFLKEKKEKDALILVVGTKASSEEAIKKLAETFSFPYVTTRWVGGTITNFKVIRERIKYYLDLKDKQEKGELAKYTKKEQLDFSKELRKLEERFGGLVRLTRIPDVLFVIDPEEHETAVREARRLNIPIVGVADTNDNPTKLNYPIIANDHAKASVTWVTDKIIEALQQTKTGEVI